MSAAKIATAREALAAGVARKLSAPTHDEPRHSGDPCPACGMETDTDRCGPLYCPACEWQSADCQHGKAPR